MILRPGVYLQNRFEVQEMIGSGGMSEVYRAHDYTLNRDVAIKVLKKEFSSDEEFVKKFKMEAEQAAQLQHPNVVNIFDVIDESELHYIVMELVKGITLKEYIRRSGGHLELREAVGYAIQIAQGIGAAHRREIIHRDVKPQNMILSEAGTVKVADFGIARAVTAQTMSAQAMGSVHYISPEQARGVRTDERSDIYSLGITIYEMVTGKLPFTGDTAVSVALAHIENAITPPSVYNPEIPVSLEKLILKCTAKDADARYQNVDELIADLKAVLRELTDGVPAAAGDTDGNTQIFKPVRSPETDKKPEIKEKKNDTAPEEKKTPDKTVTSDSRKNTGRKDAEEDPDDDIREDDRGHRRKGNDDWIDRMLKIIAIILALAVAVGILFVATQFTGLFRETAAETTAVAESTSGSALSEKETYVPYVIGLSQEDAEKKLAESELNLTVSGRKYSDQFLEGLVMEQEPEAGSVTAKHSKAGVIISLGAEQTDLSSLKLTSMNYGDAATALQEKGFRVEKEESYSDTVAADMVADYSPKMAKAGDVVTLTVSVGPEVKTASVPNIIGVSEDSAKAKLEEQGLILGQKSSVNSDTVPAGTVIRQIPDAGSVVNSGTGVDYVVSLGPAAGSAAAAESTAYMVEPIGGDTNSRYVASINNTYELSNLIGPGSSMTSVTVMIRLRQDVNGQTVYKTLMEPRTVTGDTIMPVRFKSIEGAYGIDTGYVEIVRTDTNEVLQTYEVQFFKVQ